MKGNVTYSNVTYSIGGVAIIEKAEKTYGVFSEIFRGIEGNTRDFIPKVKLLIYNKLTHSVSEHQILNTYSEELMEQLGMKKTPTERSIYRTLERVGKYFPILLEKYQELIKKHNLAHKNEVIDFSSTYIEGEKAELGALGFSRDRRPDRLQINFGISTGINGIPTALTTREGNMI